MVDALIGGVMARPTTTQKSVANVSGASKSYSKRSGRERVSESSRRGMWSKTERVVKSKMIKMPTSDGISVGVIRQNFGVSQEELARVTGYSTRSIAGWEAGQTLSDSARQKLTETERLRAALSQLMPKQDLGEWLRTPNEAFEGQSPIQVIERGESDRLWRMIFQIDANVAS
jgi:DNA-binding transcriptional regulator YiaG